MELGSEASSARREACGVFGIYAPGTDVARTAFFALFALQHRGQESAGIAVSDGRTAFVHRGMGLVTQVFNEQNLRPLTGHLAVGHTRYSTTGGSHIRNAQPYLIDTIHGPLAVAHNGNLAETARLRRELLARGVGLSSSSDSEIITQMLAAPPPGGEPNGAEWEARIVAFMDRAECAYSLVILTRHALYAVRDPLGVRPLCLGELGGDGCDGGGPGGLVVASESCALATIGARLLRDVRPGEILRIDDAGLCSLQGRPPSPEGGRCVFEQVYFARPDSTLDGQTVHAVRQRLGMRLWQEAPSSADLVVPVPDSATSAAIGYARAAGIPYGEGLIKNRYIGRTFIQPDDRLRRMGVQLKYNPLVENLRAKRVVLVDDSIVRGNTAGPLVRLLRAGGAAEVHLRVSSPPLRHPCFLGVDMLRRQQLVAHGRDTSAIRDLLGADSLAYLSHQGLVEAVSGGKPDAWNHCSGCFTGHYPAGAKEPCTADEADSESISGA